jgi:uncharacterized membrane protein YfcA
VGVETTVFLLLILAAGAAGWVDAVAGGGGLIQLPSVLAAGVCMPEAGGVNKTSSVVGTIGAMWRYARAGHVRWRELPLYGGLAFVGSLLGSWRLIELTADACDALIPFFAVCFLALAAHQVYRVLRPRRQVLEPRRRPWIGGALMFAIGVYDGFIGPGAGVFLFSTFSTCFALSPLAATGTTKAVNVLTNAAALTPLILGGHVIWPLGLAMAAANFAGGQFGAHLTIRRGAALIRLVAAAVSVGASVYLLTRR